MKVDFSKHFWIACRTFGIDLGDTIADLQALFFEDSDHIVGRATARAQQHQFHWARPQIAPTAFRSAIHQHRVATIRFTQKTNVFYPLDTCFHCVILACCMAAILT